MSELFQISYLRGFGSLFSIFHRSNDFEVSPVEDVDKGEFKESSKNKTEAWSHPNINGLHVRDFRKGCCSSWSLGRERKHGEDTQGYTGGYCRDIQIKRHPGEKNNQDAWNVDLDKVITNISFKVEADVQTSEIT